MRALLDTHVLIWLGSDPERLSAATRETLSDGENEIIFSVVSIWETAIKFALERPDFDTEPAAMRLDALASGLIELPITSDHALAVPSLPPIHGDPFDRLLAAQARAEGVTLVTADAALQQYPVAILRA